MKLFTSSLLFFLASTQVLADYSVEISGEFGRGTREYKDDGYAGTSEYDLALRNIHASAYISSVQTQNVPWGEAGFLSKLPSVSFSQTSHKRASTRPGSDFNEERLQSNIGLRWVFPGSNIGSKDQDTVFSS